MTAEAVQTNEESQTVQNKNKFELLNVIVEKVTGTVKWFSIRRHYGFIQRDDNNEDVFVHRTAITGSKYRYPTLKNGETVEFSVVETTGGVNAASVTGPNGQDVKGVRLYRRPKPPTNTESGEVNDAPVNGNAAQPAGDVEGSRPRGGTRRLRRPRRQNQLSPNGMGDAGDAGEASGEGAVAGTEGSRQRPPRRFRGGGRGRPGGNRMRQQSGTKEEQQNGNSEGGDAGPAADDAAGAPRGPRRGGGRIRRGGGRNRRNGPTRQVSGGENAADSTSVPDESPLENKMEEMSLENKKMPEDQQQPQPATEPEPSTTEPPKQESACGDAN